MPVTNQNSFSRDRRRGAFLRAVVYARAYPGVFNVHLAQAFHAAFVHRHVSSTACRPSICPGCRFAGERRHHARKDRGQGQAR
ncbi:hypothetical protein AGR13a_Cc260065 [Agrobacterium genomosp. 13 str. CFBP 6927]|uniref:Uncharacterized protein n=1 Tax=Agrobacterium genomosp. 13 str. CFBP 6927 TaxID=1183428 RepID=A0ABP2BJN9_9HYPH|nr:hypothetical protein AGR13a_Cc260065 [Agrobacterium genomosp. 13 str. CFBP 6927]